MPDDLAREFRTNLLARLEADGWDLSPTKTKVLMLTHNALAAEQGYPSIAAIFPRKEAFVKKEDPTIEFFADKLEPMCSAYTERRYGEMFRILGRSKSLVEPMPISSTGGRAWIRSIGCALKEQLAKC